MTDTVANWGGPAACGDSGAVINVTVPSATPSGDTVYLSGNYDVLGTGIPASDDWVATDYPMTRTGPETWSLTLTGVPVTAFQYKFTLSSWNNVEETGSCGTVANRTFGFDTADATYTATDTVAAWAGVGSCCRSWPFWRRVTNSTVEFSGSRLRNAARHPEQFG